MFISLPTRENDKDCSGTLHFYTPSTHTVSHTQNMESGADDLMLRDHIKAEISMSNSLIDMCNCMISTHCGADVVHL